MENDKIIRMITEKCDVYYDDALLSKEKILEKYLLFFAKQINSEERTVSFAFHTGSLCFDAASVVAVVIGCLAYGFSSNDEIGTGQTGSVQKRKISLDGNRAQKTVGGYA